MRGAVRILLLAAVSVAASCGSSGNEKVHFPADSPGIRYVGRVLYEDSGVSFDWSGTYVEFGFTGGYCAMKVSDTKKNYYNVFVDGILHDVVSTFGRDSVVVLAGGLDTGAHSLRLQKRTEGEQGRTTIHDLRLAAGGKIIPALPRGRHMEFIGNSLTCGYGTEGRSKDEPFLPETENCDYAYGCISARYFDADYTLIAHSGRGAARNYGYPEPVSPVSMKDIMTRLFDEDSSVTWDFGSSPYRPDIVVINLGSNDFSTLPHPSQAQFTAAYELIIARIREGYGDVPVLCVAPRIGEPAFTYIRDLCDRARERDAGIHFAAILPGTYNGGSDLGSSGHPNHSGQRKMAMALIPFISSITGWELSEKPVI